jgi:RNA polymerase sigma-70 factor (sigma-E family)
VIDQSAAPSRETSWPVGGVLRVVRRQRDTDAEFTEFVAARSAQLYRSAYLLGGSSHAAEDLVQTALAKTYAAWWRVRSADDPVAYVHGVLIKTFLSERRRRSSSELPFAAPGEDRPASDSDDPSERLTLLAALAGLAPVDRAVVVLRFWEDQSVARTAAELHLTEAAVKNRSLRALRTLRGLLSPSTIASHS